MYLYNELDLCYYALHIEGAVSVAFVRPYVPLSVAYIANNSRTQNPSEPKFGRKVPHLRRDSHTSFKVKRSEGRVTRPINADTHRAPYLPNGKAYELQTRCADGGWRSASATGAMTSKVKDQVHKVTWSVWAVLTQWPINRKRIVVVPTKLTSATLRTSFKIKRSKVRVRPTNTDTQNVPYIPNSKA